MSGSFYVRRVEEGDARQLMQLRLAALLDAPDAFESSYETSAVRPIETWQARVAAAATGDRETVVIAESDEEWVAMAGAFTSEADSRTLYGMWVDPAWRRTGVAHELLGAVIDWARNGKARELRLWVVEDNEPALALYERHGFLATGHRKPMAGNDGVYEIEMTLRLSGE